MPDKQSYKAGRNVVLVNKRLNFVGDLVRSFTFRPKLQLICANMYMSHA